MVEYTPDLIQRNFERFHQDNPHVYALFDRFARELMARGQHGSAKLIFERIRWEMRITTATDQPVKLNNNYSSRYARLWERRNPHHEGFFRTRRLSEQTSDSTRTVTPEETYHA